MLQSIIAELPIPDSDRNIINIVNENRLLKDKLNRFAVQTGLKKLNPGTVAAFGVYVV